MRYEREYQPANIRRCQFWKSGLFAAHSATCSIIVLRQWDFAHWRGRSEGGLYSAGREQCTKSLSNEARSVQSRLRRGARCTNPCLMVRRSGDEKAHMYGALSECAFLGSLLKRCGELVAASTNAQSQAIGAYSSRSHEPGALLRCHERDPTSAVLAFLSASSPRRLRGEGGACRW